MVSRFLAFSLVTISLSTLAACGGGEDDLGGRAVGEASASSGSVIANGPGGGTIIQQRAVTGPKSVSGAGTPSEPQNSTGGTGPVIVSNF